MIIHETDSEANQLVVQMLQYVSIKSLYSFLNHLTMSVLVFHSKLGYCAYFLFHLQGENCLSYEVDESTSLLMKECMYNALNLDR